MATSIHSSLSCLLPFIFPLFKSLFTCFLPFFRCTLNINFLFYSQSKLIISKFKIFRFKKREYRDGIKRKETRQG